MYAPRLYLLAVLATSFACSGGPAAGTVGADCPNDNNCLRGLYCKDNVCARRPPDAGPNVVPDAGLGDAGQPDAGDVDGGPNDAGVMDAGPPDAGCEIAPMLSVIQSEIFGGINEPSCNQSRCHGGARAGDLRLDSPLATLHADLLGPTRANGAPEPNIVVPGQPAQSRIMTIMTQPNPGGGGGSMPPTGILGECEVQAVREWIEAGALQN